MVKRVGGLKKPWFHILLALAGADLHGSGIAQEVQRLSEGRIRMWPVALYGSLQELCDRGLISELKDPGDLPPGATDKKRYYRIASTGRKALSEEALRMSALATEALRRA